MGLGNCWSSSYPINVLLPLFGWFKEEYPSAFQFNNQRVNISRYFIPVVPHKVVAELSKIGNYTVGEVSWCDAWMADPVMDRKVVVIFGVVAVVTSPTTAGCSAVERSAM